MCFTILCICCVVFSVFQNRTGPSFLSLGFILSLKMKRKLELGTDVLENPAKMLVNSENIVLTNGIPLAEHSSGIRRPLMASSPQTTVFCNDLRRQLDFQTSLRHPASQIETAIDPAREAELRRVINSFVGVYEQLDKTDDADVKPNYSYTELAFLAMLRSPNFCLPINEIYRLDLLL